MPASKVSDQIHARASMRCCGSIQYASADATAVNRDSRLRSQEANPNHSVSSSAQGQYGVRGRIRVSTRAPSNRWFPFVHARNVACSRRVRKKRNCFERGFGHKTYFLALRHTEHCPEQARFGLAQSQNSRSASTNLEQAYLDQTRPREFPDPYPTALAVAFGNLQCASK
jgi:hypothetical protein